MTEADIEPRCPSCDAVVMRAGTMCTVCDHDEVYGSPNRTSPPLTFGKRPGAELPNASAGIPSDDRPRARAV